MTQVQSQPGNRTLRSSGVGASEVAAVLGIDKYTTPLKLYQLKVGEREPDPENAYTRAGHLLEDAVAQYFDDLSGHKVIKKTKADYIVRHPETEIIFCHPDREYYVQGRRSERAVLECKTTQMTIDKDDIPKEWFCQLQYQLGTIYEATGKTKTGAIAWLQRGLMFDFKEFDLVGDFYQYLKEEVIKFWLNHVVPGIPPEAQTEDDLMSIYPLSHQGKTVGATDAMVETYHEMKKIKYAIDQLQEDYESKMLQVKMAMRDAEAVTLGDGTLFTWKSSSQRRLDQKKVKALFPNIYDQCAVDIEMRRFLIK